MNANDALKAQIQQSPDIPLVPEDKSGQPPSSGPAVNTTPGASVPASSQQSSNIPLAAETNDVKHSSSSPAANLVSSTPLPAPSQQSSNIPMAANKNNNNTVQPPSSGQDSKPDISLGPSAPLYKSSKQNSKTPPAVENDMIPIASANTSTPSETTNSKSVSALDSFTPLRDAPKTDASTDVATVATIPTTNISMENLSVPVINMTGDLNSTTTVTTINTTASTMTPYPPALNTNMHSQIKPPVATTIAPKSTMSISPALNTPPPQVTATALPALTMKKTTTPLVGLFNPSQISTTPPPQVHDTSFNTPIISTAPPPGVSATATPFDFSTTDSTIVTTPTPGIAFTTRVPNDQRLSTPATALSAASTLSDMSGAASVLSNMSGLSLTNPKSMTPTSNQSLGTALSTPGTALSAASSLSDLPEAASTPNNLFEAVSNLMCEATLNGASAAMTKVAPEGRQRALNILKELTQQATQNLSLRNIPGHEDEASQEKLKQMITHLAFNKVITSLTPPQKNPNVSRRVKVRVPKKDGRRKPKKAVTPGIPSRSPVTQKPGEMQKIPPPSKTLTSTPPRLPRPASKNRNPSAQKSDKPRNTPPPAKSIPSNSDQPLTDDQIKKRRLRIVVCSFVSKK